MSLLAACSSTPATKAVPALPYDRWPSSLLAWHTRWRWPVLATSIALVGLISFSRLYLGVHFPSDVLGAWTGALAWVVGLYLLLSRRLRPRR